MPNFLDTLSSIFGSTDALPWTDTEIIQKCERDAAQEGAGISQEMDKAESYMRLSWALVHSHQPADVQRGILMLEASLGAEPDNPQKREILYLLAVGHYRAGDITRARRFVEEALAIARDFHQGVALQQMIEQQIAKDGAIGIGLAAAAVGLVAGGIAALVSKSKR